MLNVYRISFEFGIWGLGLGREGVGATVVNNVAGWGKRETRVGYILLKII